MKKTMICVLLAAAFVLLLSSVALAAMLICVSHQDVKAEMSVDKCLAQGMEFAIMDDYGFIRILSSREIELTKKVNPKAFETPGYGLKHHRMAPEIPPLPVTPEAG